jgi:hypothetical protein
MEARDAETLLALTDHHLMEAERLVLHLRQTQGCVHDVETVLAAEDQLRQAREARRVALHRYLASR